MKISIHILNRKLLVWMPEAFWGSISLPPPRGINSAEPKLYPSSTATWKKIGISSYDQWMRWFVLLHAQNFENSAFESISFAFSQILHPCIIGATYTRSVRFTETNQELDSLGLSWIRVGFEEPNPSSEN